ncbi:MAG: hypothetical protein J6N76_08230, partial [Lachnospiraceae bacterium]|nr:hypothetical protein [Lachnospiraceae bacterium]
MKLKNRIVLICCIIWVLFVVLFSGVLNLLPSKKAFFNSDSDSISFMGNTYVSDNSYGHGNIYQINETGKVKKIYQTRWRNFVSG